MEEYTPNKNNKTEDIRIVTDFKDELERIKQKLASDFSKYSEMEKMKNKQKANNQRELMLNSKNTELKLKETNEFNKLPTLEELKKKYGIIQNKQIPSENQSNFSTTFNPNSNSNSNSIINSNNIQNNNQYSFMTKIDIKKKINSDNKRINKVGNNNININDDKKYINNNYFNTTFNNKNNLEYNELRRKYVELDSEDRNNFTFKNNNMQKMPILKIDSGNIDNMNYNYMNSREQRRIESPLSNRVNNISNNNTSILLNSKLDQQIKLINEKSENNRLEEEKTQMKIREIENQLQLDERLTHNNREIRKNALKELSDMCQKDFNTTEDKQKAFDYFSPWIKYCLEETNSYVIPECLNFFIIFNTLFPHFLNVCIKDFFDNVERFISFGISSINESCIKIFIMFFNDKKLYNLAFNELIKLLVKASSAKTNKFLQEIIFILLKKNIFPENYIKILFEKILHIYTNCNKNNDKKKIFTQIIKNVYYYIEDDYQIIKKNIKLTSSKDLDNVFNKIYSSPDYKKNEITYTLYPRPIQTDIELNSNMDYFNSSIGGNDRQLSERRNNNYKSIYEKGSSNQEKKNNWIQIGPNGEVNDIISVLPSEFFEYHFVVQFQQKMKILENSNDILNKIKFVKDKSKNLIEVYKTINYSIEDSNILIHLEGIKMLENICKLINENINAQKLKLLLETCFTKLKDKKSIIKNELFNLFNIVIEYQCFELNKFISFILNYCSNDKNDNSIIKLGLLEYIKSLFLQENRKVQNQIDNISEKEFLHYTKKVINIIEKESLSLIKDLCSDLLIILKRKINSQRTFYDLIESLPNYRKKMIQTEEKNEMNESMYRKNLRQIKSSYSFSNIKKRNRNTKSLNNLNYSINSNSNSNMNSIGNDSICSNNTGTFNKYNKINIRPNQYSKNNIRKINKKKLNISLSNSPPRQDRNKNYKRVNANTSDIDEKIVNKTEIRDESHKKYDKLNNINNINNKIINNENNMESLEQKKLSLLKSIDNINEDTIEKYSKIIIKDFFAFIKKICQHKTDDLATHFELIFMIYEKIFNRIIIIMKENKDKNKHQNVAKFIKLIDDLMNLLTKVMILAPGIQQIKGSTKFNIIKLEKYLCIFSNYCFNKEKYYMHLLLNLYKLCEGGDDDFPTKFNPKYSTIFFLNYVKKVNNEINSKKILNILKQFIAETNVLSLSEKNDLLEGIELSSDNEIDVSFGNINKNKNNKNEEDEERNIIRDKNNKNGYNNKVEKNSLDEEDIHNLNLPSETDNSKLKNNDLNDIEKKIKLMSNRLSLNKFPTQDNININTNNRNMDQKKRSNSNNNEIIKENNDEHKNKNKVADNNEVKKSMNTLNIPISIIRNKLTLNNKEKLLLKIHSTNRSPPNNLKKNNENINLKPNNTNNTNNINTLNSVNIIPQSNKSKNNNNTIPNNSKVYIQTINQIIKILKNESTEEGIFNLAISQFLKLSSVEQKSDFINYLNNSLKNPIFFKNISINVLLNFYDFILSLLSFEILKFSNEESNIATLQSLAQNLLDYCDINDIFKVLLFLLKKYFPKDLNKKIEDISLVMIKIIAYFLKELLKNAKKGKINGRVIICEINDLFTNTPPSNLTTLTPNCSFYQNIFTLLKTITDQIISQDKKELSGIIKYLQEKKIVCEDYMQYLIRLNNSFNK